jgi:hypothetical protein
MELDQIFVKLKLMRHYVWKQGLDIWKDSIQGFNPMNKYGDWIDARGTTYDAVGPVPNARFFNYTDFTAQISKHLLKQGLDYTVVDLTGLNATQVSSVRAFINTLSEVQRNHIMIIGIP